MLLKPPLKELLFFGAIAEIFNFFGRSLSRWAELALMQDGVKKLNLKKLCTTRSVALVVDVAINQLVWRFEGQRQVAELFKFLFPDSMLQLSDEELEIEAKNLQMAYSADFGEDLVSEVRSFRREFRAEIKNCKSVKDVLTLLVSSDVLSSMPELGAACILFSLLHTTSHSLECGA